MNMIATATIATAVPVGADAAITAELDRLQNSIKRSAQTSAGQRGASALIERHKAAWVALGDFCKAKDRLETTLPYKYRKSLTRIDRTDDPRWRRLVGVLRVINKEVEESARAFLTFRYSNLSDVREVVAYIATAPGGSLPELPGDTTLGDVDVNFYTRLLGRIGACLAKIDTRAGA